VGERGRKEAQVIANAISKHGESKEKKEKREHAGCEKVIYKAIQNALQGENGFDLRISHRYAGRREGSGNPIP